MNGELDRSELAENADFAEEAANGAEAAEIDAALTEEALGTSDGDEANGDAALAEDNTQGEENAGACSPEAEEIDYEELMRSDLNELKEEFPELTSLGSVAQRDNPLRYAALRDMGLSPREAYLAASYRPKRTDNRSHLRKTAPGGVGTQRSGMSRSELLYARELFSGMSDTDIYALYKKVSE